MTWYHVARVYPKEYRYECQPLFMAVTATGELELYMKETIGILPETLLAPTIINMKLIVTPDRDRIRLEDSVCWAEFDTKEVAKAIVLAGFLRLPGSSRWLMRFMEPDTTIDKLFDKITRPFGWIEVARDIKDIDDAAGNASALALYILGLAKEEDARELLTTDFLPLLTFWRRLLGG